MKLSLSLVNLFLSPMAVAIARQRARARKHKDFFHRKIAIYCAEEQVQMLTEAVDSVADFFGDEWGRYQKCLKTIVLDNELQTIVWVARKAVIIQETDEQRMQSVNMLAASLVADCERIQTYRENRCSVIVWKSTVLMLSKVRAEARRTEYLSQE